VQIINEPVKFSVEPDGKRYVEVHRPLATAEGENPQTLTIAQSAGLSSFITQDGSDKQLVNKALARRAGIPVVVSAGGESQVQSGSLSAQNSRLPEGGHEQAIQ